MANGLVLITSEPAYWVTCSLSVAACLIMFFLGLRTQSPMKVSLKLILYLSLSDFLICFINLICPLIQLDNDKCQIIAFIKVFGKWSSLFWCSSLSLLVYYTLKGLGQPELNKIFRKITWGCILLSTIIASMPLLKLAGLEYVDQGNYCQTNYQNEEDLEEERSKVYAILTFIFVRGIAYFFAIFITIFAYIKAVLFYKSLPVEVVEYNNFDSKRLLTYPIAQLIIYTPTALYTFLLIFMEIPKAWLLVIICSSNLSGFINLLVYGQQFLVTQSIKRKQEQVSFVSAQSSSLDNTDSLLIKA